MLNKYKGNLINIYIGKVNERIICISLDKKIISTYMKYIRRLEKHQYSIDKESIIESDYYSKYEDYIIDEFHGYYLPNIDINIIIRDSMNIDQLLKLTSNNIKELVSLLNYTKNVKEDELITLLNSLKIIEKYKHGKYNKKISKVYWKAHPIFFCDINSYLNMVDEYLNYKKYKN